MATLTTHRTARTIARALTFILLCGLTGAAAKPHLRVDGPPHRKKGKKCTAKLYLEVKEENGQPVGSLETENVKVKHDNKTLPIRRFTTLEKANEGVGVIVAIDTSGSMDIKDILQNGRKDRRSRMQYARPAAREFIKSLKEHDRAAILTFDNQARFIAGFDDSRSHKQIVLGDQQKTKPVGNSNTVLYDAVVMAAKKLGTPSMRKKHHRRAIVLITDGEDNASTYKLEDAIDRARKAGVAVYGIGYAGATITWSHGRRVVTQVNFGPLARLCRETGGEFVPKPPASDLSEVYKDIGRKLHTLYVLEVNTTNLPIGKRIHAVKIQVTVAGEVNKIETKIPGPLHDCKAPPPPIWKRAWFIGILVTAFFGIIVVVILLLRPKKCPDCGAAIPRGAEGCPQCAEKARHEHSRVEHQRREDIERSRREAAEQQALELKHQKDLALKQAEVDKQQAVEAAKRQAQAAVPGLASLVVLEGPMKGQRFELSGAAVTIGRNPGSHVLLNDGSVSGTHATIRLHGNRFRVEDSSSYGTKVNGTKITARDLSDKDEVKFGDVHCQFRDNRPAAQPQRPAYAALIAVDGPTKGARYEITTDMCTVGRDGSCDVCVSDDTVSKRHLTIQLAAQSIRLVNHATYGTKVNGEPVDDCELQDGDEVKFGNVICKFADLRR